MAHHFHIVPDYGLFYGELANNLSHSHYAIQISASLFALDLTVNGEQIARNTCFLKVNEQHSLKSKKNQLTILVSVWSEIDEFSQMNRFWRIVLFFSLGDA